MGHQNQPKVETPTEITIYYSKGTHNVTLHADGAWAGITGQLEVQLAFYTELQPMPNVVRHKVVESEIGPMLGPILAQNVQPGIIRETQATITMNPIVTINLIQLLHSMLAKIKPNLPEPMKTYVEAHESETMKTSGS
jgi:Flp pilus assembly protein TadG